MSGAGVEPAKACALVSKTSLIVLLSIRSNANGRNRTFNPFPGASFQDRATHRAVHVSKAGIRN